MSVRRGERAFGRSDHGGQSSHPSGQFGVLEQVDTRRANVVGSFAMKMSRSGSRSRPSAPIVVETTALPMAIASRIFRRVPPPIQSGTTTVEAFANHGRTSGTEPLCTACIDEGRGAMLPPQEGRDAYRHAAGGCSLAECNELLSWTTPPGRYRSPRRSGWPAWPACISPPEWVGADAARIPAGITCCGRLPIRVPAPRCVLSTVATTPIAVLR